MADPTPIWQLVEDHGWTARRNTYPRPDGTVQTRHSRQAVGELSRVVWEHNDKHRVQRALDRWGPCPEQ